MEEYQYKMLCESINNLAKAIRELGEHLSDDTSLAEWIYNGLTRIATSLIGRDV